MRNTQRVIHLLLHRTFSWTCITFVWTIDKCVCAHFSRTSISIYTLRVYLHLLNYNLTFINGIVMKTSIIPLLILYNFLWQLTLKSTYKTHTHFYIYYILTNGKEKEARRSERKNMHECINNHMNEWAIKCEHTRQQWWWRWRRQRQTRKIAVKMY